VFIRGYNNIMIRRFFLSLLVVGTVAMDSVTTPFGNAEPRAGAFRHLLFHSASYFTTCALWRSSARTSRRNTSIF